MTRNRICRLALGSILLVVSSWALAETQERVPPPDTAAPAANRPAGTTTPSDATATDCGTGTITLTSPNGGETWTAGSTHPITWTSAGIADEVIIELFKGGVSQWYMYAPASQGRFDWTICPTIGDRADYTIRIRGSSDCGMSAEDTTDAPFAITGSAPGATLTLTSPVGGETFIADEKLTITWTFTRLTGPILVRLNKAGEDYGLLHHSEVSDGQYEWHIRAATGDGTDYTISLETTGSCGEPLRVESAPFAITGSSPPPRIELTSPTGGETWTAGSTYRITWTSENLVGGVAIRMYTDNQFYYDIGAAPAAAGGFDWTICPTIGDGNTCIIEVWGNDGRGSGAYDRNHAPFTITGSAPLPMLTVTSPSACETWTTGSRQTVTWVADSLLADVRVTLWKGGGSEVLLGWAYASDGKFNCLVPTTIGDGTDYTVVLQAIDTCSGEWVRAESAPFTMATSAPPPALAITSPNGGETWTAGSTQAITWTSAGIVGNVEIQVLKNGQAYGGSWSMPASDGRVDWSICDTIEDRADYSVRISGVDECGQNVADESDQPFAIVGSSTPPATLTLTSPVGGETWAAGTTHSITWTSSGLVEMHGVSIALCKNGKEYAWLGSAGASWGRFEWTVCSSLESASDYTLRVFGYDSCWNRVSDESDQPFTITGASGPATLTVTSPNGGESWTAGSVLPITWAATSLRWNVHISLLKNGYTAISLGHVPASLGKLDWPVCPSTLDGADYTIQLVCTDDCGRDVTDESDAPFALTGIPGQQPTLTLTSPRADQTYTAGGTLEITWTGTNLTGDVTASLTKGGTHIETFERVPAALGKLDATLCPSIGDGPDYTVEIYGYDACGQMVYAETDGAFSITGSDPAPAVTLISPNGGETWTAGTTHTITWTANFAGGVSVRLVSKRMGSLNLGTAPASAGSFDWTICTAIGDGADYTIEVSGYDACTNWGGDGSDAPFAITGSVGGPSSLTLTSPNGGETWTAGTTHTITWTGANLDGYVGISLVKGGQNPTSIYLDSVPASAGEYDWQPCSSLGNGTEFTVSIYAQDICGRYVEDTSDALFAITGSAGPAALTLTSPNGGESWPAGSTQTITWSATSLAGNVDAYLYRGDEYVGRVGSAPAEAGRLDWTVCRSVGNGDRFSIELQANDPCVEYVYVQDRSDGPFSITGSDGPSALTVTSPNGGEIWTAGTIQTVTWTGKLLAGDAQVSLYKDGRSVRWLGTAPASAGRFDWRVCSSVVNGTGYTVNVASPSECGDYVEDASDAPFTIAGGSDVPTSLTITSPNGGETWTAGATQTITWAGPGIAGNVGLALLRQSDSAYFPLGSAPATDGRLDAMICPSIADASDYRLFIYGSDACGKGYNDYSDGTIAITGSIGSAKLALTSPNGGEKWAIGTTHTITWTSENLTGSVEIMLRIAGMPYRFLGSAPASDGRLAWTIDSSTEAGNDFTIRLDTQDACGYSIYRSSSTPFTITRPVPADFDKDSDVDIADFQHLAACFNGPNQPPGADSCADADFDTDADVDLTDFGAFRSCFNGANRPPACP